MSINLFFIPVARLGYTYLRLKDNHMEILNKDDEIERLVVAAPQRATLCSHASCPEREELVSECVYTEIWIVVLTPHLSY